MEILYVLVPLSLLLIGIALLCLRWAVRSGQYDDMDGPAHQILFDDDSTLTPSKTRPPSSTDTQATAKPDRPPQ